MTDDNWQSVKLAIGFIDSPYTTTTKAENKVYAVNAEVIAGRLLAGNQLVIQDGLPGKESTFIVDRDGARLTNASFTINSNDGLKQILLSPERGIQIFTRPSKADSFRANFWANTDGTLTVQNFNAKLINATSGTIGGFNLNSYSLYSTAKSNVPFGTQYEEPTIWIQTNGRARIGSLFVESDKTYFYGTLYAENGTIGGFNIGKSTLSSVSVDGNNNPYIQLNTNGSGRLGLLTFNRNTATFDGNIYAKNLDRGGFTSTIIGDKFDDDAFTRNNVNNIFANRSINLDKLSVRVLSANYIESNYLTASEIASDYATIGSLNAAIARIGKIETNYLTADNLEVKYFKFNRQPAEWIRLTCVTDVRYTTTDIDGTDVVISVSRDRRLLVVMGVPDD